MRRDNANQPELLGSEEIQQCANLLRQLVENPNLLMALPEEQRIELLQWAGKLARPDKDQINQRLKARRKMRREVVSKQIRQVSAGSGIRRAREDKVFIMPKMVESEFKYVPLPIPRTCYICNESFDRQHHFYEALCPSCAELNYAKRFQTADLQGQIALITGARLKIGYQATLMMLEAGASVIATTRFPVDAAMRYAAEPGFVKWGNRLHIYGLDLRHTPSVELFTRHIRESFPRLDILLNNAAQTVRRPSGFYEHLLGNESLPVKELAPEIGHLLSGYVGLKRSLNPVQSVQREIEIHWDNRNQPLGLLVPAELARIPYSFDQDLSPEYFPQGHLDADLQQVDLRESNSWRLKMGEIETAEMLEVQLVNAVAPFVLTNRLTPMMKKDYTGQKHIVNVTAMEGKFHRFTKSDRHPHTNMAKAALNMMTHTSANDLAKSGIYMNAVDTGWVTDEDPVHLSLHKQNVHDFQPPLDIVDGAARICDPFFDGINSGKHWCGRFLKDYFPIDW